MWWFSGNIKTDFDSKQLVQIHPSLLFSLSSFSVNCGFERNTPADEEIAAVMLARLSGQSKFCGRYTRNIEVLGRCFQTNWTQKKELTRKPQTTKNLPNHFPASSKISLRLLVILAYFLTLYMNPINVKGSYNCVFWERKKKKYLRKARTLFIKKKK